jgi:type IV fimbrial biogenesis protein FimT
MVVVAIVAILASLAAPSFRTLLVSRTVLAAGDTLVSDLTLARSEALKRSSTVTICRSTNGSTCNATVGSWSVGWIVFIDLNADGVNTDAGGVVLPLETVIRVQQAFSNIATIQSDASPGTTLHTIRYDPTGRARGANQTFNVTPTGTVPAGVTRVVCTSVTGRPSIRAAGVTICQV